MIFANYVRYGDEARILKLRPEHRKYMIGLLDQGKAVPAGSFPNNSGALYFYEVDSREAAEQLMTAGRYFLGNAIAEYHIAEREVHCANPSLLQLAKDPAALDPNNRRKA
jgi:uncharacterized protein YciI